jgi:hypothetical protein
MSPVIYTGSRDASGTRQVTKQANDRTARPLAPRLDLWNHSPTGFECGYNGSGPAQLALALLADVVGDEDAVSLHQPFKFAVVGRWPREGFTITAEAIETWAEQQEGQE